MFQLENSPRYDKVFLPPAAQLTVNNLTIGGGSIVNHAIACCNTYMTVYDHNIACLNLGELRNLLILSYGSPTIRGNIALAYTYLIQTPVYITGAVKGIWSLSSIYIWLPHLGLCYLE